jgi:TIR domain
VTDGLLQDGPQTMRQRRFQIAAIGDRWNAMDRLFLCWFAPHDLPIGGKIMDGIDAAIRSHDQLLLVLSEHAIRSDWVEDEVKAATS